MCMRDRVGEIAALVGWTGRGVEGIDWRYVESELGVVLPADYKLAVERFPYGSFNGSLRIEQPRSSARGDLERYLDTIFAMAEDIAAELADAQDLAIEVFPRVPGLFPWATIEGEHTVLTYLPLMPNRSSVTYVLRPGGRGRRINIDGAISESIIEMIMGRVSGVRGLLATDGAPYFRPYPSTPAPPACRTGLPQLPGGYWAMNEESEWIHADVVEPVDAVPQLLALGLDVGRAQCVDWPAVEGRLGLRLPSDYKQFIETIGPGTYGRIVVASPNGPTADAPGLFDVYSVVRERYRKLYGETMPALPSPGGPLLWGLAPHGRVCAWRFDDAPPDRRSVVVFRDQTISFMGHSMTGYLNWYLRDGETVYTAPWIHDLGDARQRWKLRHVAAGAPTRDGVADREGDDLK